ncbi:MAG: hypothetical protein A3H72_01040 [Candidatus Doudnabacteria bacterium RIFCSPLOWO2_02_FULL_48_8]|uniref:Mur ligase central domain-containing protein n=1 Tax=Candidatus Doudnabacteria bacterium RIFCSPHIGHO2_01_FULL_46_24 TaxID=1817825 RepID=A0A1F5NUR0_9BACT|nr:MAG: hypothetical protein A2720_02595 [Candidatus Doudnabacteria bacterium RIFCSPHIGHO2_01_FULL_46_24]OGE94239.1 MAG: hypothetical protein A3E98_00240 [Candidatus Doudnabacteria bacterium RIFCSPHIGHO2_12_FULL_48_11]OGE94990.1 MAG: hypothetical protein A3H72_01040 [Candidatus Doudnabacteria bacterium RIFCSPLOWO2_02_FULL_48_8]
MTRWPILHQLYFLQLNNYSLLRYWKGVFKVKQAPRKKIVWTPKALAILTLSILFAATVAYFEALFTGPWFVVAFLFLWLIWANLLAPIFLSLSVLILFPLDFAIKHYIVAQARTKMRTLPKLKIIGITGSFGKTTMKESLSAVLSQRFKVLTTPENINTPLGISRLILDKLDGDIELFVVEMGAYKRGDIFQLCAIAQPDIVLLTGINEAHLELFGGIKNTIAAKFEIVVNSKSQALVVLNSDSELIKQNYQKYLGERPVFWYSKELQMLPNVKMPLLGSYAWGVVNACVIIAKELGLSELEIRDGIGKIKQIPHRLQILPNSNGVVVIDDSYNGNPDGAAEAIKVLAGFQDKRKIYVTPGLVEMGSRTEAVHKEIGKQLAHAADVVILIKNSATPFIEQGLLQEGFKSENIKWFGSAHLAHNAIKSIVKPGDVILFQNDWPENYT